ncbi:MAG: hypothetical protein NC038_02925 [Paludibacter sp.]|nr:hypothetical protein [Bacteroidales bacterium]MCM1069031.1 hypothetical protein [Prevotella sp.]MCM1353694.1 hypothetical protein [Bacteroides sp.]MCM1441957.1 hypothetical protein [Muribaculum sp.]MCM1481587.1 hypothetical protein [Paludibacter sp.]
MAKNNKHKWDFQNIGGTTRVNIHSGEDIRHLSELDQKMWTVLSCPVSGLEIDSKSLQYADADADGKIHVNDVIRTARWLTDVISDADLLLHNTGELSLESINRTNATGQALYNAAKQIALNLGKTNDKLTVADTDNSAAIFAQTRFNGDGVITEGSTDDAEAKAAIAAALAITGGTPDRSGAQGVNAEQIETLYASLAAYTAWQQTAPVLPYGNRTEEALQAYIALDGKMKDFFMRNKLAAFSHDSTAALDIQTARIEAISAANLAEQTAEIASYPIARINGKAELNLNAAINPAWAGTFDTLRTIAIAADKETLNETEWKELGNTFADYTAWKAAKAGTEVEPLGAETINNLQQQNRKEALLSLVEQDKALTTEADGIDEVNKLLHLYRDFGKLLHNFVTLQDFYARDKHTQAIFQAGTLIIDQRACHLCMRVADMSKHDANVAASGMYLIYCNCTTKSKPGTLQIVAAMTVGDTGDLRVGKNAIFYDRDGLDWDAVVTKIVENPISISQAFWSPYRRMAKWVEDLINKNAADKDSAIMSEATAKLSALPATPADTATPAPAQPFDIAKFAGIFAALGMALGMIGSALVSVAKGFSALTWWQGLLAFVAILLVISGPSMIMAWLKLRKRNIAPLLNANGWAVNASSTISIPFGATLTDIAKFPKLKLKDPYAQKGMPAWQKWCLAVAAVIVVVVTLWLCNLLSWAKLPSPFHNDKATTEAVCPADVAETVTDTAQQE